jgi:hypothetical protein
MYLGAGRQGNASSGLISPESKKIFDTNMESICKTLQRLVVKVYCASYGTEHKEVECTISCIPRLQINTVDELVQMYSAGLLPGKQMGRIMSMLVGEHIPGIKNQPDFNLRTPAPPVLKH